MPRFDEPGVTILQENDPHFPQPEGWKVQLRPHQLRLIDRCLWLERAEEWEGFHVDTNFGGICDSVGSGKSYCVLALATESIDKPTVEHVENGYTVKMVEPHNNVNVVVVPHGLVAQWSKYLMNTSLRWYSMKTTKEVLQGIPDVQVVLVSSTQYSLFAATHAETSCFARVFYDEADSINVPGCPTVRAKMYWFVSATLVECISPSGRERVARVRTRGFIRDTLSKILNDRPFKNMLFIKNRNDIVAESLRIPPLEEQLVRCKSEITRILNDIVPHATLSMLQAGDVAGVIQSYGARSVGNNNVIEVVCADLLKAIEDLKVDLESCERKHYTSPDAKIAARERIAAAIADKERKVELIRERVIDVDLCPISYDEIKTPCVLDCCKRTFELESIVKLIDMSVGRGRPTKCPFCTQVFKRDDLIIVSAASASPKSKSGVYSRADNVAKILGTVSESGKVLIFSEYDATFELLTSSGIQGRELKGSSAVQAKTLEWFAEEGGCKVLLLNSHHFGAGVNLEMATDLIIYHAMSESLTTQVVGRAQRSGRKESLRLWRFVDA